MARPSDPIYDPSPERRRKHGAVGDEPVLERYPDGKLVGRCAGTITPKIAQDLLESALVAEHRRKSPPFRFNVYEGIPYKAHGTKDGRSPLRYWGYPLGPTDAGPDILERLRNIAKQSGHEERFDEWLRQCRDI